MKFASMLLASVAVAAVAGSADARQPNCANSYCLYDSHGTAIGPMIQVDNVLHNYENKPYSLQTTRTGLIVGEGFAYTTVNCTGQKYGYFEFDADDEPNLAQFDGVNIWSQGPATEIIHVLSYDWYYYDAYYQKVGYTCYPVEGFTWDAPVAIPILLDSTSHGWVPPFSVR